MGVNFRKLAAIDVAFLGPVVIKIEFTVGVIGPIALGIFSLLRGHSFLQAALGIYLICIGINYGPMFFYALSIRNRQQARLELGDELIDKRAAMSKYRRQSLLLLIPLAVPVVTLIDSFRPPRASDVS